MTWRTVFLLAYARRAEESADRAKTGLDALWLVTAAVPWDLPTEVEMLARQLLPGSWWDALNADRGLAIYAGRKASVCVLVVDLDSEVKAEPNPRHPVATWYPESLPSQQWYGPRGERPVAAHVLAYAAGRDQPMDRGVLRGSVE